MRILLVSQMYPGPDDPDLGTFVAQMERALQERGHDVDRAVLDTRGGGKLRYLTLARRALRAPRPDVVYAHFLVPSGLIAATVRAPLVVTAHGRDRELLAAAQVVGQPSLVEPLGQAVLEAMAMARSVVATRIGGPPEFVPPEAGVLVDPLDIEALAEALRAAAALPCPNPAARAAAERHDVKENAQRVEELLECAARRASAA